MLKQKNGVLISGKNPVEQPVGEPEGALVGWYPELQKMTVLCHCPDILDALCLRGDDAEDIACPGAVDALLPNCLLDSFVLQQLLTQLGDISLCGRARGQDFCNRAPPDRCTSILPDPGDGDSMRRGQFQGGSLRNGRNFPQWGGKIPFWARLGQGFQIGVWVLSWGPGTAALESFPAAGSAAVHPRYHSSPS